MIPALVVKDLSISFGGLRAVSNVDLKIQEGVIFGLIGPNGAGKTTLFNLLTGVYKPTSGKILGYGNDFEGCQPPQITRFGLARTFQNIRLFKNLTVLENVLISIDQNSNHSKLRNCFSIFHDIFASKTFNDSEINKRSQAILLLQVLGLEERASELAGSLPYGDQRRLEIVRAIATGAKLLLLDEPAAGMNPQETKNLMMNIRQIRDQFKVTILLIEHDMKLVMGVCERIAVLDHGVKIAEGSPAEIQKNPSVIEAYLGKGAVTHG